MAASASPECRIAARSSLYPPASGRGTRQAQRISRSNSLAAVFTEARGLVEHLLIGTGTDLVPLEKSLREKLRAAGIRAEPMATAAAARTYSVLLAEDRRVAAALIAVA